MQTRHPAALGAPLTNEHITTDFSESLIELVTPPFGETWELLQYLCDIHQFVYRHLNDELLWATSMPCALEGDASIPLAQFGTSNVGRMKTVYRHGLGVRYGRIMQAISGVHFNYSFSSATVGSPRGHQSIQAAGAEFRVRAVLRRAAQLPALRLAGAVPVRHLAGGVEEFFCRTRNRSRHARRRYGLRAVRHLAAHERHRLPQQESSDGERVGQQPGRVRARSVAGDRHALSAVREDRRQGRR